MAGNKDISKFGKKTRMKKGQTLNPNGRPKKISTILKKEGLKESQIKDLATEMLNMTIEELAIVANSSQSTTYEKMIAMAIKNAIKNGDLSQIFGQVLPRCFGQPKQPLEHSGGIKTTKINVKPAE